MQLSSVMALDVASSVYLARSPVMEVEIVSDLMLTLRAVFLNNFFAHSFERKYCFKCEYII